MRPGCDVTPRPRPKARALLSCVAPDELALGNDVTLHRGVKLAALRPTVQIQFAIESENFEGILVRA